MLNISFIISEKKLSSFGTFYWDFMRSYDIAGGDLGGGQMSSVLGSSPSSTTN